MFSMILKTSQYHFTRTGGPQPYKPCFLIKLIESVAPGDPQPSPHYAAVGSGCFLPYIRHINDGFVVNRSTMS